MKAREFRIPTLLFSVAAVIAAVGYLIDAAGPARAQDVGPFVVGGEAPWIAVAGTTTTTDEVVYTAPPDRMFVLTGVCMGGSYVSAPVYEVATVTTTKIHGARTGCTFFSVGTHGNFLTNGNARIPFAAGSGVALGLPSGVPYTVQGFLAQP